MNKFSKVIFIFSLIAICYTTSLEAAAQPRPLDQHPEASDYLFLELATGAIAGALAPSALDAYLRWVCRNNDDPELCVDLGHSATDVFGVPLLWFGGSFVGVVAMGGVNNVDGNIPAAMIGSLSGTVTGLLFENWIDKFFIPWAANPENVDRIVQNEDTPRYIRNFYRQLSTFVERHQTSIRQFTITFIPPLAAAILGAIGYNVGATVPSS